MSIQPEARIHYIPASESKKTYKNSRTVPAYVLYWMQTSIRASNNHALEYAIETANQKKLPLAVIYVSPDFIAGAQEISRQDIFLQQGLRQTAEILRNRNISLFSLVSNNPAQTIMLLAQQAAAVIGDFGYLDYHRRQRNMFAQDCFCPSFWVESNVCVPITQAYHKEAFSARILRPAIHSKLEHFLTLPQEKTLHCTSRPELPDIANIEYLSQEQAEQSTPPNASNDMYFFGGEIEAQKSWQFFLEHTLDRFHLDRNDPALEGSSKLSPYLRFGMISPIQMALDAREYGKSEGVDTLWEELIIRRELSFNFTHYNPNYRKFSCLPAWAQNSLLEHSNDPREFIYSQEQLENAQTHDAYWNAAQNQLSRSGWMHGYMRMYWGKKVIEWTTSPQEAWNILIKLNDRWELDGNSSNGYAGIAWCFGKHDRAWKERSIFGKIRYMNEAGLRRKFDINTYAARWTN